MANETQNSGLSSVFGGAGMAAAGPIGAAAGNFAGAMIGDFMANRQMERQLNNQKELQKQAFQLNQLAVQNQAQNEVIGLRNAGLNPAAADGAGAPAVQNGSAAMGNVPTLGNIFDGIAEIIQAAKAPSDIAKTQAETTNIQTDTGKKEAETTNIQTDTGKKESETALNLQKLNDINPQILVKTKKDIELLNEEITNARNINDVYAAEQKFLKENAAYQFDVMRNNLMSSGVWDTLQPKTRSTIEALAGGDLSIGSGELNALQKLIDSQTSISSGDKQLYQNAFDTAVLSFMFSQPDVMAAIAHRPADEQLQMLQSVIESSKRVEGIMQQIETAKTQAELNAALKQWHDYHRESEQLDDYLYLYRHQDDSEQSKKDFEEKKAKLTHEFGKEMLIRATELGASYMLQRGAVKSGMKGATLPLSDGPTIRMPTESELMKYNAPKTFGRHLDYSR